MRMTRAEARKIIQQAGGLGTGRLYDHKLIEAREVLAAPEWRPDQKPPEVRVTIGAGGVPIVQVY